MSDITIPGVPNPNTTKISGGATPKFRYVYFAQDVTKGEPQQWDISQCLGYGVEDCGSDNCPTVAGVAAETRDVSVDGYWGWIQTAGYADYLITDGSVAAPATDPYLRAMSDNAIEGLTTNELEALGDNSGALAVIAINLAADSGTTGKGILICHYQ